MGLPLPHNTLLAYFPLKCYNTSTKQYLSQKGVTMAYTKLFQHNLHLDKMQYSSGVEPVVMNILDKNVYTLELKILEGGVAVDLTGLTLEFLEGSNTLPHTVTDAVNGVVTLVFDDISSETATTTKEVILKVVNGSVERHYRGFKRSFYTLP